GKNGIDGAPGAQGPQGLPGVGALKLVDQNDVAVGVFQYPGLAALQVGGDLVWVAVNWRSRNFETGVPAFYYASSDCSGQAMMYVDLLRFGTVQGTTLNFPQGNPTPMTYYSVKDENGCNQYTNEGAPTPDTFAPAATASLASFIGPFKIAR
ncbi:MAG TPA: hypothetical protein VJN96_02030, partial [Vicinamibacterales bacterium]|nr:hypothetical protein [Vicinamibacterales bacterium]